MAAPEVESAVSGPETRVAIGVTLAVAVGALIYVYIYPVFNLTWAFVELIAYPLNMFVRWLSTI